MAPCIPDSIPSEAGDETQWPFKLFRDELPDFCIDYEAVAMTRARDALHLFGSGPFDFLRELEGCGKFAIARPSAVA